MSEPFIHPIPLIRSISISCSHTHIHTHALTLSHSNEPNRLDDCHSGGYVPFDLTQTSFEYAHLVLNFFVRQIDHVTGFVFLFFSQMTYFRTYRKGGKLKFHSIYLNLLDGSMKRKLDKIT